MSGTFSTETVTALQGKLDAACSNQESGVPGAVFVVVGRDGKEKFAYAGGKRGYGSSEPMTLDSIFSIASCTKMIVGVACMQLVEQGILTLDDASQVDRIAPELKELKVLQDGKLVEQKRGITLRMLLTHTAGFGYSFFNDALRDFNRPIGYDEFSGHIYAITQPLVRQPGEGWQYGVNMDWAGILVERASGLSLNDYFHRYIFEPLGVRNISTIPDDSMKANLAYMNQRALDGQLSSRDHLLYRSLIISTPEDKKSFFHSGGAGCFANPQEYCKILATLLNDGTSPITGKQILRKETVDEMFRNQIPEFPNFGRQGIPPSKPELTNAISDLYPNPGQPQGWGLTFMLTGGATGRSSATAWWAGLPNLYWWCDRERGVAGIVASQILPFADPQVLGLWVDLEATVYNALA